MLPMPGITKEYAKSTEARKIAKKEQEEIGWKKKIQPVALGTTNENTEIESETLGKSCRRK